MNKDPVNRHGVVQNRKERNYEHPHLHKTDETSKEGISSWMTCISKLLIIAKNNGHLGRCGECLIDAASNNNDKTILGMPFLWIK